MNQHHYRDLLRRAVLSNDGSQLGLITEQLMDAERAREILRSKGYGRTGMSGSAIAAQVPDAATASFIQHVITLKSAS